MSNTRVLQLLQTVAVQISVLGTSVLVALCLSYKLTINFNSHNIDSVQIAKYIFIVGWFADTSVKYLEQNKPV